MSRSRINTDEKEKEKLIEFLKNNSGVYRQYEIALKFHIGQNTLAYFIKKHGLSEHLRRRTKNGQRIKKNTAIEKGLKKCMPFKRIRNGVTQYCGAWDDIDIMLDAGNSVIKWVRKMTPDIFTDDADSFVPVVAEVG